MGTDIGKILKEALDMWVDISEVSPTATSWKISFGGGGMGEHEFYQAHQDLNKSLKIDPTNVTACMLLRGLVAYYQEVTTVSIDYILNDSKHFNAELAKIKAICKLINHPLVNEIVDEFKKFMYKASDHYGYDRADFDKIFEDKYQIAMDRYYALIAADELTEYQFSSGKFDKEKPDFYKGILKFPSVEMAVKFLASHEKSLIALALIRDDFNDCYSHFAFLCKNGDNIYILSDDENWVHPMQKQMSRRPDKHLERKQFAGFLPYQLIDAFDDENKDPDKTKGSLLAKMTEIPPNQMVWLTIVFEKLHHKYWNKKRRLKKLAYFTSGVAQTSNPEKQIDGKKGATKDGENLPALIQPMELPRITKEEMTTEKTLEDWQREPTRLNEWLEKRYEDKVPEFVLNADSALLSPNQQKLLKADEEDRFHWENPSMALMKYALDDKVNEKALKHCKDLKVMPKEGFGTMEALQKTQRWFARYNKAQMIQYFSHKEFEEREEEITAWWKKSVNDQQDRLIKIAVAGEFQTIGTESVTFGSKKSSKKSNILILNKGKMPVGGSWGKTVAILGGLDYHRSKYYCPITNSVANIFATFEPKTAEAIADLLDCKIKDFPDVLQTWWKGKEYYGNSILDNLDPMEWVVKNPWEELRFKIVIPLSRRAFKKIRKELELPPFDLDSLPEGEYGW